MAIKIDLHAGAISHAEFMKLIKGGASLDLNTAPPKPFKWILDAVWLNLVELSSLHPFTDILQQVLKINVKIQIVYKLYSHIGARKRTRMAILGGKRATRSGRNPLWLF